jgi:NarL family two-component system response regulator LiaR
MIHTILKTFTGCVIIWVRFIMNKIRIVIADDHTVFRQGTRGLLERENDMEVVGEAGDGEEAIKIIERLKPDVAILDIAMPKLNGVEVTKRVKPKQPSTAILILTAYDDDEYIFALLEAGAAGYLLKDVDSQEVVDAVRAVHTGESVLHPVIARKVVSHFRPSPSDAAKEKPAIELSEREMEVLRLAAKGMSNNDIADALFINVRTVQGHLSSIFNKLSVGSRTEAIFQAVKRGWLSFEELS